MADQKFKADEIIGFHGEKHKDNGFLSNFYPYPHNITISNFGDIKEFDEDHETFISFNCSEQFFMFHKAMTFYKEDPVKNVKNIDIMLEILDSSDPKKIKQLGRQVKGFTQSKWDEVKYRIMYDANLHKFTENHDLEQKLLDTGDKYLVEASPTDKVWGIGMRKTDPDFLDQSKWKGTNLLGKVLMEVRKYLQDNPDHYICW
jgi:ribA/ribD-fused uncharacterized protein